MSIAKDYLEPTDTQHQSETKFIDQLLEGWGKWSRATGIDQRPVQAGDLWKISQIIEAGDYVLKVMDDWFVLTDKSVASLPYRLKQVVIVEYIEPRSARTKAREMGLAYLAYRQRLHAAQWTVFAYLEPWIVAIKRNADVNAVKNAARFRSKPVA
jgi:hypothetical protein